MDCNACFVTTDDELIALKEGWNRLVQSQPETDMPFYSWDWFYRSWIHFGKPCGQELYIVAIYEASRLIGILPLVRSQRKSSKITYRILSFCNVGMMPRTTIYTESHDQESVFRAAWNHLFDHRSDWDMMELANVLETSPFHRFILEGEHRAGYALIQNQSFVAPFIELTGTLEEYCNSLSRKPRQDLRSRVKHFNDSNSSPLIRFFKTPNEIREGLEYLEAIHANSWKKTEGNPHHSQFYHEVMPILAEVGEVQIAAAFLDDAPISVWCVMCKNGTYYACFTAYDLNYRGYSPGIVLLYYQLEQLLKEGGKIFDFCGTTYAYKEKYATGHLNHSTFQVFHSGFKSRFVYWAKTLLLPLARKMMRKPADKDLIAKRRG